MDSSSRVYINRRGINKNGGRFSCLDIVCGPFGFRVVEVYELFYVSVESLM